MKYSQQIGVIAAVLLIATCFMPWIEVPNIHQTLTGVNGRVNENITFGKPIILHAIFCIISIPLFLTGKVWAKRTNIFICFITLSLALKNYILYSMCRPECPIVKPGLYCLILLALLLQLMALLPKLVVKEK